MEKIKKPSISSQAESLAVKEDNKTKSKRGRSKSRGRIGQNDRSKSRPRKDVECHYCHKKGHIRRFCHELKRDLEERKNQKPTQANVINNKANEDEVADMLLASMNGGSLTN